MQAHDQKLKVQPKKKTMTADFRMIILTLKSVMLLKYVFKDHSCIRTIATQTPRVENELDKILLLGCTNSFFLSLSLK